MVNQIELIRSQLTTITALLDPGTAGVSAGLPTIIATIKRAADDLDKKLIER